MKYTIKYFDNQGVEKKLVINALNFGEAVTRCEDRANEIGHGLSAITVTRGE